MNTPSLSDTLHDLAYAEGDDDAGRIYLTVRLDEAEAAIHQYIREEFLKIVNTQLEAAKANLKYHYEKTKNPNLIREWEGTVTGIMFCRDAIEDKFGGQL